MLLALSDWGSMNLCDAGCPTADTFGDALGRSLLAALAIQVVFALAWVIKGKARALVVLVGVPVAGAVIFLLNLGGHTQVTPEHLTHSPQTWAKLWMFDALVVVAAAWTVAAELIDRRRIAIQAPQQEPSP